MLSGSSDGFRLSVWGSGAELNLVEALGFQRREKGPFPVNIFSDLLLSVAILNSNIVIS